MAKRDSSLTYPVPVVRLIIPDEYRRILILRRQGGTHATNRWCLPGGKVDYGGTVRETVTKELREETNLECLSANFLFYQDGLPPAPGEMHCINLYFACRTKGDITLNDESSAFAWLDPVDVDEYHLAFGHDEGLRLYWRGQP